MRLYRVSTDDPFVGLQFEWFTSRRNEFTLEEIEAEIEREEDEILQG